jgi:hypothetical protein
MAVPGGGPGAAAGGAAPAVGAARGGQHVASRPPPRNAPRHRDTAPPGTAPSLVRPHGRQGSGRTLGGRAAPGPGPAWRAAGPSRRTRPLPSLGRTGRYELSDGRRGPWQAVHDRLARWRRRGARSTSPSTGGGSAPTRGTGRVDLDTRRVRPAGAGAGGGSGSGPAMRGWRRPRGRPGRSLASDASVCRRRDAAERCVGWPKERRSGATRSDKLAVTSWSRPSSPARGSRSDDSGRQAGPRAERVMVWTVGAARPRPGRGTRGSSSDPALRIRTSARRRRAGGDERPAAPPRRAAARFGPRRAWPAEKIRRYWLARRARDRGRPCSVDADPAVRERKAARLARAGAARLAGFSAADVAWRGVAWRGVAWRGR